MFEWDDYRAEPVISALSYKKASNLLCKASIDIVPVTKAHGDYYDDYDYLVTISHKIRFIGKILDQFVLGLDSDCNTTLLYNKKIESKIFIAKSFKDLLINIVEATVQNKEYEQIIAQAKDYQEPLLEEFEEFDRLLKESVQKNAECQIIGY